MVHDKDLNTRCPEGQHDGWRLVRSVGEASTLRKVEKGSLLPDQLKVLNGSLHDSVPLLLYGPLDVVVRPLDAAVERVAVDAFARSDAPADAKSLALGRLQTNAEKTSWKAVAGRRLAPAPLRLGALITIAVLSVPSPRGVGRVAATPRLPRGFFYGKRVAATPRVPLLGTPWGRVAATPRLPRGYSAKAHRGDAAAAT